MSLLEIILLLTLYLDSNGRDSEELRHMLRPASRHTGPFSAYDLQHEADRLIEASLSQNTAKTYDTGLSVFHQFSKTHGFEVVWPPSLEEIVQFVAYMSLKNLSPNTAKSYISAVGYKCKISGFPDVTQNFIVHKLLEGMKMVKYRADTRLPITPVILQKIISILPEICSTHMKVNC